MIISEKSAPIITIDGPSGTGKGTICRMLADHLQWHRLDSGYIYRVLALAAKNQNIPFTNIAELVSLANHLNVKFDTNSDHQDTVLLDNENVMDAIRSEECGQNASCIAIIPEVRQALLFRQRAFATPPGLVTDGRDMGTVVFPEAILKIYLEASAEERAQRRYQQLKEKGFNASLAQVVDELASRDARDISRIHAPLKPASDAIFINTTGLTITQTFKKVLKLVQKVLILH